MPQPRLGTEDEIVGGLEFHVTIVRARRLGNGPDFAVGEPGGEDKCRELEPGFQLFTSEIGTSGPTADRPRCRESSLGESTQGGQEHAIPPSVGGDVGLGDQITWVELGFRAGYLCRLCQL